MTDRPERQSGPQLKIGKAQQYFSTDVNEYLRESAVNSRRLAEEQQPEPSSRPDQIKNLRQAYQNEDLVLVLGAGVSMPYNLPSWNTLLQSMLLDEMQNLGQDRQQLSLDVAQLFNDYFNPSPLIAARYLSGRFKEQELSLHNMGVSLPSLESAVRTRLYATLQAAEDTYLMKEIRQLCAAASSNPRLNAVISYNFDDILEQCLKSLEIDIPFRSIFKMGVHPHSNELPIYHVHGFLPRDEDLQPEDRITFSEDIYHEQYSDIYSWSNMVQINKFRDNTCLFIGLSFTDPNMRRLLDIANKQRGEKDNYHCMFRKRHDPETLAGWLKAQQNSDDGEQPDPQEIQAISEAIVETAHNFDEQDLLSFGVHTIWIDDFDEIPEIVRQIRLQ